MSDDVTIPRETARRIARVLRDFTEVCETGIARMADGAPVQVTGLLDFADLLDPKPRSLRDEVRSTAWRNWKDVDDLTDAVLAVAADWLAAQPLMDPDRVAAIALTRPLTRIDQREHDVRLMRGQS